MALAAGVRLGPQEVLGLIDAGGMGEVYQAKDTRLDRTVAIKVLPADICNDLDRRARFNTIAALSHPHMCTLHDVGEHSGTFFLVMEHLTAGGASAITLPTRIPQTDRNTTDLMLVEGFR